jgi:ribosomal protein S18 acetylase RimI-like enzyme
VTDYRTFRNPDPPRVADVWNASLAGPRTVLIPPRSTGLLECFTLAKPYFDRDGLILAFDGDRPVGLAHAGFAGTADSAAIDRSRGVVCTLGVAPSHRRQGVGSELIRRAEDYLRQKGAKEILAGPCPPANPFTFGLYGGADSPGFLASEGLTRPFLEHRGYQVTRSVGVFRCSLKRLQLPPDPRFLEVHASYDILGAPYSRAGWYQESVIGPVEAVEYRLQGKGSGQLAGRIVLWDMATFGYGWGETCVGMLGLTIDPSLRRRGLAKYLVAQVLLHLQHQSFDSFEACVGLDDEAGVGLFRGLGFEQADTGHCYRKA